jgi:hypothetical protein
MEEHLPPEGTTPVPAERVARERAVRHVVQAHPNDLVDPWWMNEALTRDYGEILYKEWSLDLEDVDPAYVDERLPDGVRLVRRGTMLNSRKMDCVFEMGEALAAVALARRRLWIGVAGRDLPSAQHLLAAVEEAFPEPAPAAAEDDPRVNIAIWTHGDDSRAFRRLDVAAWQDIESNYAPSTREAIAPLMAPGYEPGRGQLLVWHGAPGTGKSYALSSLAFAWREWASFSYIADPDALLGDTAYLLEWMTLRHPLDRWRVAILEDTGELFGADAGRRTGQGLARLLNATDGMLAKGSKTMFVITTNEPISHFHQAVVRPGRCASRVEFDALPVEHAKAWLLARGAAEVAKRLREPATVAELFAMVAGDFEPSSASVTGTYL